MPNLADGSSDGFQTSQQWRQGGFLDTFLQLPARFIMRLILLILPSVNTLMQQSASSLFHSSSVLSLLCPLFLLSDLLPCRLLSFISPSSFLHFHHLLFLSFTPNFYFFSPLKIMAFYNYSVALYFFHLSIFLLSSAFLSCLLSMCIFIFLSHCPSLFNVFPSLKKSFSSLLNLFI